MSDDELGYCEAPDTGRPGGICRARVRHGRRYVPRSRQNPRCPVHGDAARLERMKAREARIAAARANLTETAPGDAKPSS